jgi:hypothetical protein
MLERPPLAALALRAAVKLNDEGTLFVTALRPGRHHTIINALAAGGWTGRTSADRQGFAYEGRFISREDAARITGAKCNYQPGKLFSEDLW